MKLFETKLIIQELLNMKIVELLNWFHYVHRNEKKKICYHTFHSTKGLEYENVAIILEKILDKTKACLRRFLRSMENQSIKFLLNMKRVEIFYMWQLLEQLKTCVFCTLMIWKRYG